MGTSGARWVGRTADEEEATAYVLANRKVGTALAIVESRTPITPRHDQPLRNPRLVRCSAG